MRKPKLQFVHVARSEYGFLIVLTLLSLILQRTLTSGCCNGPDFSTYLEIAELQRIQADFWLSPQSFKENFWAMLYPTFLFLSLSVSGGSIEFVQWLQMLIASTLGIGSWLLTFSLGRSIRILSSTVVAFSPTTMWIGHSYGYEVLLAWFLTFGLAIAWLLNRREEARPLPFAPFWAAASGLLIGLAVLTQSKAIIVLPVVFYLLWKKSHLYAWCGLVGLALPILPWSIRNLLVLGTPNVLSGNAAYNLWIGNNAETTTGGSMATPDSMPKGSAEQLRSAIDFIVSQPEIAMNFIFRKAMRLWEPTYIYPEVISVGPGRTFLHILAASLSVLILVGLVVFLGARTFTTPPRVPDVTPLAVFVLLFYASHLPFIAEPRFMSSVYPVTVSVSVPTLMYVWKRFNKLKVHE